MNKPFTSKDIARYFDSTMRFYSLYHGKSNGLHYGFNAPHSLSVKDAIIHTNRFLSEKARIKDGEHILDAGCGIGGSAIWLAKQYPQCTITGISIASKQIERAKELARKEKVTAQTRFYTMDYMKTSFAKHTFDVVWAIESVCYATSQLQLLKEMYRVLKPGGKIIIADGFLTHRPETKEEHNILRDFFTGFHLNRLPTLSEFRRNLHKAGFKTIHWYDKTQDISRSVNRIYWTGMIGYPFAWFGYRLGIFPKVIYDNAVTAIVQKKGMEKKMAKYGVFLAEK